MRSIPFAAIIVPIAISWSAIGGATITWSNSSYYYDNGNYPSAAQGVNTWADAHQGASTNLWYHVNGQQGYNYDQGYFPTIATDTWGNYIDIHQADSVNSYLWFKIGYDNGSGAQYMLNSSSLLDAFGSYDWGMSPVIAVHGHNCSPGEQAFAHIVQVHQGGTGAGPLWMNFADATNIDCNNGGSTPQWGGVQWFGAQEYSTGFAPSVAINSVDVDAACILEVHQEGPGLGTVSWQSGTLIFTGSSWSYTETASDIFTPAAQHASVCIYDTNGGGNTADTGVVVMEFNDGSLWSFDGPIGADPPSGLNCVWTPQNAQKYDWGAYPRVSCQSGALSGRGGAQGVEVHQGSSTSQQLWYRTFTGQ
jgi:hypothetical protein